MKCSREGGRKRENFVPTPRRDHRRNRIESRSDTFCNALYTSTRTIAIHICIREVTTNGGSCVRAGKQKGRKKGKKKKEEEGTKKESKDEEKRVARLAGSWPCTKDIRRSTVILAAERAVPTFIYMYVYLYMHTHV